MKVLASILETLCLRCSKCNRWLTQQVSVERKIEWGVNAGGIIFMDPFYLKTTRHHCGKCGRVMRERTQPDGAA